MGLSFLTSRNFNAELIERATLGARRKSNSARIFSQISKLQLGVPFNGDDCDYHFYVSRGSFRPRSDIPTRLKSI